MYFQRQRPASKSRVYIMHYIFPISTFFLDSFPQLFWTPMLYLQAVNVGCDTTAAAWDDALGKHYGPPDPNSNADAPPW